MRSRSSRLAWVTAPAVALALLLGACGSDEQAGTPAPAPTVVGTPAMSSAADPSSPMTEDSASSPESSTEESSTEESSTEESSTEESSTEESSTEESSPESSTEEVSTEESSTEESSTEESSTAKPTDKSSSAPVKGGAPTKPGTKLKIGEPAVVEFQTGKKSDSYYQHGTMSTTVTKIVKADPKVFDKLDNKADFKDFVPYYVFSEAKILSYEGKKDGNPPTQAILYGLLPDGSEAGKAFGLTSLKGCEDSYFEAPKVGATATKCSITLGEKGGDPVIGAAYQGDTDLYADSKDNPYTKSPVVWGP